MSATELDLPVLIASEQIRRREFVTTRRGYDPDQVRDYLESLADQVDLMATMIRDARMEADALMRSEAEPKVDPYERLASRISGVLRSADEAAERFRHEARRDADRLMEDARTEAERIRTDARAAAEEARRHAERALHEAREQANATISGLSTRRDAVVEQLAEMRERLLGVAHDLEATIVEPPPGAALGDDTDTRAPGASDAREAREATASSEASEMPATPAMPPSPSSNGRVVDVRTGDVDTEAMSIEALFADLDEEAAMQEALWAGTGASELDVPEIPPLDLDWGPDLDEDERS